MDILRNCTNFLTLNPVPTLETFVVIGNIDQMLTSVALPLYRCGDRYYVRSILRYSFYW